MKNGYNAQSNIDVQAEKNVNQDQQNDDIRSQIIDTKKQLVNGQDIGNMKTSANTKTLQGSQPLDSQSQLGIDSSQPSVAKSNLATFVKLKEGVNKITQQLDITNTLKLLKNQGTNQNPKQNAANYRPTPKNFRPGADLRNKEVTDPLQIIGEDNDYINMSKTNIITSMHPNRITNAKILKHYNPNYKASDEVENSLVQYKKISRNKRLRFPPLSTQANSLAENSSLGLINKQSSSTIGIQQGILSKQQSLSFDDNSDTESNNIQMQKTIYNTIIDGQLLNARFKVDNFSQGEQFLQSLKDNLIGPRKPKGFKQKQSALPGLKMKGMPAISSRLSMMGPERLPPPDKKTAKLLKEAVYEDHRDSSDDDITTDKRFRARAKDLADSLIYALDQDTIIDISESIREHKYQQIRKAGKLTDTTIYELGFKKSPYYPDVNWQHVKENLVNKVKYKVVETNSELIKKDFVSKQTAKKIFRTSERTNPKSLQVATERITDTIEYSDDEEKNQKRSGLPSIKNFYKNFKDVEKKMHMGLNQRQPQVAYINEIERRKWNKSVEEQMLVLPMPLGIANRKGSNNSNNAIDLNGISIGNDQARALGESLKYSNAEKVYMKNNRLNTEGALRIIKGINKELRELNLSDNPLINAKDKLLQRQRFLSQRRANRSDEESQNDEQTGVGGIKSSMSAYSLSKKGSQKSINTELKNAVQKQVNSDEEEQKVFEPNNQCINELCTKLENPVFNLEVLYLNNCRLTDKDAKKILFEAIYKSSNTKISKVYLNQNNITDKTCKWLSEMLCEGNTKIKEIGFKSNKITSLGGNMMAKALIENRDLKSLDLSWNLIGVRQFVGEQKKLRDGEKPKRKEKMKEGEIGAAWGTAFKENKTLIHLDLSYNQFEYKDAKVMEEDLKVNKTLIGFHFKGNKGTGDKCVSYLDSLGFMRFKDPLDFADDHFPFELHNPLTIPDGSPERFKTIQKNLTARKQGNRSSIQRGNSQFNVTQGSMALSTDNLSKPFIELDTKLENCWICEGWIEGQFEIDLVSLMKKTFDKDMVIKESLQHPYQVFIHFDFENYDADKMDDLRAINPEMGGTFKLHKMLPQGYYHYFFSYQHVADAKQGEPVDLKKYENYIFIDDSAERVQLGVQDKRPIQNKLAKTNRFDFTILDFNLEYLNQVNSLQLMHQRQREINAEKGVVDIDTQGTESYEEFQSNLHLDSQGEYNIDLTEPRIGGVTQMSEIDNVPNILIQDASQESILSINSKQLNSTLIINKQSKTNILSYDQLKTEAGTQQNDMTQIQNDYSSIHGSLVNLDIKNEERRRKHKFPKKKEGFSLYDDQAYKMNLKYCQIRPDKTLNLKGRTETPWSVEAGLFKDYLKELRPTLVTSCFNFDWAHIKVPKMRNSAPLDVKDEMFRVYHLIKEAYRVQSGSSPAGNVFAIGMNQIAVLMHDVLDCLDETELGMLKSSDSDRIFITVNSSSYGLYNPSKFIVRCQLMEFFMRCAIEKFYSSKICETEIAAIKKFNDEFIEKKLKQFNQHKWRQDHTFNIDVDNIMKAYVPLWEYLYKKYSGKHKKPGGKDFMMYDEFDDFVGQTGLINDSLAARDASMIFNLSMFTQIDEIEKGKHLEATCLEFMEMMTRMLDLASMPPPPTQDEDGEWVESTMSLKDRQAQPLKVKIENAIPPLMKSCCERRYLASFKNPKKDKKRGHYILPGGKFF